MRTPALMIALLLVSLPAAAQTSPSPPEPAAARAAQDGQLRALEAELARVVAEQQSVYQQFQMVEGMRRVETEAMQAVPGANAPPGSAPSYDDMVRERKAREQRLQGYVDDLARLYARHRELDDRKRVLLDQIQELSAPRR